MNWITVSIIAYFFLALAFVMDKILLSHRIPKPSVYAFYAAILSALSIFLIPFGLKWQGISMTLVSFAGGIFFIYALLFYYIAVKENAVSKIAPLIGAVIPIISLLAELIFFDANLISANIVGVFLLIVGGFFISFDLPIKSRKVFNGLGFSILSGIFFAFAYVLFKHIYNHNEGFINGFFWTRIGLVLGGMSLLFIPIYRKEILKTLFHKKNKKEEKGNSGKEKSIGTIALFLLNKIFGGSSSILLNYAISLGSVTLVHAVSSVQFVFVLFLARLAYLKYPSLLQEKLHFWDWAQKIFSIIIIAAGIYLVNS